MAVPPDETPPPAPSEAAPVPDGVLRGRDLPGEPSAAGPVAASDARPDARRPRPTDEEIRRAFEQGIYPYETRIQRRSYERQKARLQAELLKVQLWVQETGQRFVLLFEGRDAAGKGGTIKRFTEHLNPRTARVVALNKPTDIERGQWYFQRYVQHLPTAGDIVLFDRSWYNRAGVERVMGFCEPCEYLEFMRQTPDLERMLVRSGSGSTSTGSRSRSTSSGSGSPRARPIR